MKRSLFIGVFAFVAVGVANASVPDACLDFSRYPVSTIADQPFAEPNLNSSSKVRQFHTVIKNGAKGEPDFAGQFRVVQWGCGSNCHRFAIVDKKTGQVYLVSDAAALAARFRLDSRLFIIDPPDVIAEQQSDLFSTMSFVWDNSSHALRPIPGCNGYAQTGNQ